MIDTTTIIEVYGQEIVVRNIPDGTKVLLINHNKEKAVLLDKTSNEQDNRHHMNLHLGDVEKMQFEDLQASLRFPKISS